MQQEPIVPHQSADQSATSPTQRQDFGKSKRRESWKSTLSTVLILIIAPLIALFLTAFVFQSYEVDGPSMETTLQNRDRLIVWKIPRTFARLSGNDFIPGRGEVIVFVMHGIENYDPTQDKQLIKRVIGLPGERVVIRGNTTTIYNSEHPEGFNPDTEGSYTPVSSSAQTSIDVVVPDGEVFVMGDNRPNSLDSRAFGTVPAKDIVGTLAYRIFPLNKAKAF
jgi:signal peptidase I